MQNLWEEWTAAWQNMHRERTKDASRRETDKERHKGLPARWREGDFVLVARIGHRSGEKISVRWRGPYRITKVASEWIYEVEELKTKRRLRVHARRLKFYCEAARGSEEELTALAMEQQEDWKVKEIAGFTKDPHTEEFEAEVVWDDEEEINESTFEPLASIAVDVPYKVLKAFRKLKGATPIGLEERLHKLIPETKWESPLGQPRRTKRTKKLTEVTAMKKSGPKEKAIRKKAVRDPSESDSSADSEHSAEMENTTPQEAKEGKEETQKIISRPQRQRRGKSPTAAEKKGEPKGQTRTQRKKDLQKDLKEGEKEGKEKKEEVNGSVPQPQGQQRHEQEEDSTQAHTVKETEIQIPTMIEEGGLLEGTDSEGEEETSLED
eukprot:GHVU01098347.1.p1 GENE.GHVU01098347.1~~GHVU01098347.1.p1  ORF type:complete len:380 (-),score=90.51 GHVU01098347.1:11-1150(-)